MRYPSDDNWLVRIGAFVNVLDDVPNTNRLSPTKINAWGGVVASVSTIGATVLAWVTGHWHFLQHVIDVAPIVGSYVGVAFGFHHAAKREANLQAVRMKTAEK